MLYQAQVDLRDGSFSGIECAIRWRHPVRGLLHAVKFVDDVCPAGLGRDFMRFLLQTTTSQVALWARAGLSVPRFSVNAWPETINDALRDDALEACRASGVAASRLEVETQPEATYDAEMCARLARLRSAGLRVALDDFGEGAVHFRWLRDAPFDVVKIPVCFGRNAGEPYDDAVITATVAFARAIGAPTVIEGVETVAIRDRALALGCDIGQGYLWSQQVEAQDFPAVVAAIRRDGSALA